MARRAIDIYSGFDQEDVLVTIPPDSALGDRAGTHHGVIRARQYDDETDEWFFQVTYSTAPGLKYADVVPVAWCRRPELDDFIGIVPDHVLEQMRQDRLSDPAPTVEP